MPLVFEYETAEELTLSPDAIVSTLNCERHVIYSLPADFPEHSPPEEQL
ncbi:hypothetical protein [Deinococcus planocerae]|nr:hypothetical protein [Deinococcus planocerae]